jgi:Helix-turn-helix domain
MQPAPPALLQLAQRLRQLREQHWPDVRLTQGALARAFSGEEPVAAATISSWESPTSPKLPPRHRLLAYAQFFATPGSVEPGREPQLLPLDTFTEQETAAYKSLEAELIGLRNAARKPSISEEIAVRRSWHFPDTGPATLVCAELPPGEQGSMADTANPNYTELLSYADLDALMELHGHIRAENPMMNVFYKSVSNVAPDDLTGHVILIGGIVWNDITKRMSEMAKLPVRQVAVPSVRSGEIFVAEVDGKGREFLPKWRDTNNTELSEDVGLLARVANPLNTSRTLTVCNGIHSRGVYGAVRSLTDARLRDSNERYISSEFGSTGSFLILMSVNVIEGITMTPDFNSPGGILHQWPLGAAR